MSEPRQTTDDGLRTTDYDLPQSEFNKVSLIPATIDTDNEFVTCKVEKEEGA